MGTIVFSWPLSLSNQGSNRLHNRRLSPKQGSIRLLLEAGEIRDRMFVVLLCATLRCIVRSRCRCFLVQALDLAKSLRMERLFQFPIGNLRVIQLEQKR